MAQPADQGDYLRSASSVRAEREQQLLARYGGFSWGSDFIGFAVALFFTIVFFGIVGAIIGTVGYQMGAPVPKASTGLTSTTVNLGIAGLIGGLVAIFLAYLIGGYTAGRMARFDGVKNGIGVVIWTVVVAIILGVVGGVLGNRFNVASQIHLNVNGSTLTTAGVISLVVTLVVMLLGATLGGAWGARYHRLIDREAGLR